MRQNTFHIVSLGCAKNTVDSDSMAQLLIHAGYAPVADPQRAKYIIVNTCGFIGTARDESYTALAESAKNKKKGQVLIAAGCLTERYGIGVAQRIQGLDGMLGTRHWMDILNVINNLAANPGEPHYHLPETVTVSKDDYGVNRVSVQGSSAYLKIADGCRRPCAFCTIPLIKGPAVSRPVAAILNEARHLQDDRIREIILIAQDTTDYGNDLGLKDGLAFLIEKLEVAAPRIDWIRIMYAYPGYVTDRLIKAMATHHQIVPYLDMPLQHAHPSVLQRMHRPTNTAWVKKTVEKMRKCIPGLALRTTFILGYPGETEAEFQTLLDFVEETRFDKVGVFIYSCEPGTTAASLGDPIPKPLKEERLQRLMEKQKHISLQINKSFLGSTLDVLVEGYGQGMSVGRSYRDAPEIDGLVLVKGRVTLGEIIPVKIKEAMVYDLSGVPVHHRE